MFLMKKFSTLDILHISVFSALGMASKPIITPIIHIFSSLIMIPGGSLAGGLYMMWMVLAAAVVRKSFSATLVGFTQAVAALILGNFGNHGAVNLISYTLPGLVVDVVFLFTKGRTVTSQSILCVSANICGTLIVSSLVMKLAFIPLLMAIIASIISGIMGGLVSFMIYKKLIKYQIIEG